MLVCAPVEVEGERGNGTIKYVGKIYNMSEMPGEKISLGERAQGVPEGRGVAHRSKSQMGIRVQG